MSTSQELIHELVSRGMSQRAIGVALGRNSSLISQVARGRKPGANLRDSLAVLREQLGDGKPPAKPPAVPAPTRRLTASGKPARVRRPTTITGKSGAWATSTVKRQAARHGAHGMIHPLQDAKRRGQTVAVTVGLASSIRINGTSGSATKHHAPGAAGSVTMELGAAEDVLDGMQDFGGDFSAYVLDRLSEDGYVSADQDGLREGIVSIELRAY